MYRYIWLVPLLPLAGAAINGLLGRKLRFSEKLVGAIAVGSIALAFLITLTAVYAYAFSSNAMWPQAYVTSQDGAFSFTWIPGGAVRLTEGSRERLGIKLQEEVAKKRAALPPEQRNKPVLVGGREETSSSILNVEWSYQLDALSSIFMLVVTGVGLCIFVFATGYMHGDPGFYRFFAYMGLFLLADRVLL
jgi:NADH-quinone oxidoreductase subunit L